MATTLRQMMKDVGVTDLTGASMVKQAGFGPWPMPGVQRVDTFNALGGTGGVAFTSTDPLLDRRITNAWDMPRVYIGIGNIGYIPVCLSTQDPRMHPYYTTSGFYLASGNNYPVHIITDGQLEPWKGYQGRTAGYINTTLPP